MILIYKCRLCGETIYENSGEVGKIIEMFYAQNPLADNHQMNECSETVIRSALGTTQPDSGRYTTHLCSGDLSCPESVIKKGIADLVGVMF